MKSIILVLSLLFSQFGFAQSSQTGDFKLELEKLNDSINQKSQILLIKNAISSENIDINLDNLEIHFNLGTQKRVEGASGSDYKYFNFTVSFILKELNLEGTARLEEIMPARMYFNRERRNSKTYYQSYHDKIVSSAREKLIQKIMSLHSCLGCGKENQADSTLREAGDSKNLSINNEDANDVGNSIQAE